MQKEVRERMVSANHASSIAANVRVHAVRGLFIGGCASLVLALLGAMGTDSAPLAYRIMYWAAVILPGTLIGLTVSWAIQSWGALRDHIFIEAGLIAALVTLPHTFIVIVASALMFGISAITPRIVMEFGLTVFVVAAVLTAINYLAVQAKAGSATRQDTTTENVASHAAMSVPAPHDVAAATIPSSLADRLPPKLRAARLLALSAEDHYLRIHTDLGSHLVLMRLTDATGLLTGTPGARVHRSWWVARQAVSGHVTINGNVLLKLEGYLQVPVSRKMKSTLTDMGWLA